MLIIDLVSEEWVEPESEARVQLMRPWKSSWKKQTAARVSRIRPGTEVRLRELDAKV